MLLLALDTCTERLIVGSRSDDPSVKDCWTNLDSQGNHARDVLPAVEALLKGARPDVVGVCVGPGSFTGVRIGMACAKGLAEGWQIPLVGLDNLLAMADAWSRLAVDSDAAVLPVIDARKNKFYGGLYHRGKALLAPADLEPRSWLERVTAAWKGPVVLSGYQAGLLAEAAGTLPENWTNLAIRDWTPGLLDQLEAHWNRQEFLGPEASPRYLRLSEAEENLRQRLT